MIDRKRLTRIFVICLLGSLYAAQGLLAQNHDVIARKDTGKNMNVTKVLSESYLEVRYQRGATEAKINTDKVTSIKYFDTPDAYSNGLVFLKRGEYENAVNSFKLAKDDRSVRKWIKTYSLLQIGNVYQQWGLSAPDKFKDAVSSFEELLKLDPETRFYAEVLLDMARCQASAGDLAGATSTFDKLAKEAYDKKLGVIWEVRAKFEKAMARLEGGDFDDAERDLRSALTFTQEQLKKATEPLITRELEKIASLAKLNQGTVMIKKKKLSDAKRFFQEIIGESGSAREAKAGASCGLSECLLAEGKLTEAQAAFAKARVLYYDIPEAGAQATYFLGVLCNELKDKEPNYKKKARDYFQAVIEIYPTTDWAKKARAEIE